MKTKIKEKFKNIYTEFKKDKVLQIALVFAIISAILGCVDLKVNAAESNSIDIVMYEKDSAGVVSKSVFSTINLNYTDDYELYWYSTYNTYTNGSHDFELIAVSKEHSGLGENMDYAFTMNGETRYVTILTNGTSHYSSGSGMYLDVENSPVIVTRLDKFYYHADFVSNYLSGVIQPDIDYDSLEVDNDMLMPTNIKRNIIKNEIKDDLVAGNLGGDMYDYITWTNTSELYSLQLQVVPVVQYFDIRLTENIFTKEFYGEWNTQAIYEEVTNSFTLCTFSSNPNTLLEYPMFSFGLDFKSECNDKYSKGIFEEDYLKFGYRIRYIDVENEKASPWLVLVPTKELDEYEIYVEYADSSRSDTSDGNGLFNEYENLDDIENAKTDINTENEFKDKYEIVDGDVDVQEATNWLNTVVSFIKGTPQVVGSVLGFLPQPILYGMYVTIFLGVIASAIAIVKALF